MSKTEKGLEPIFVDCKQLGAQTKVLNTSDNLKVLLSFLGFEPFLNRMTLETEVIASGKVLSNEVVRSELISASSRYDYPRAGIDDHFHVLAKENVYHPIERYLDSKKWDGTCRLNSVVGCVRSKHSQLTSIILKRWLVGCIASIYEDNFKSKLVPVLQGEQSFVKTAFIERMAKIVPYSFLEGAELNPDNKDSVLSCIRSWIIELGELERSTKNSQGALKAFISKEVDTVRPPYSRIDVKKPRQSHFIATVNGTDFLKDQTGNSRYAVIELTAPILIDDVNTILGWEYSKSGRLELVYPEKLCQFWLEVKYLYEAGEAWALSREEQVQVDTISKMYVDKGNWYQLLAEHIHLYANRPAHNLEWLAPKQVCDLIAIPSNNVAHVGRALKLLAREGVLQSRHQNGYTKYLFPFVHLSAQQ
ncbi:virulence protein [Vibrio sp. 070316B]|uniref:VapE domain-containing protein n=1 Tax=Vibrio sp. 070316B TaxID=2607608 RepID=UPI00149394CF|nr:VapE domain-containing protein [Vibrio sp. 070316B]NOI38694.1 virulence protein [Vibrio sp. 070316B]